MSKDLKPGLYKATVRGVADVTVLVDGEGYGTTTHTVSNHLVHEHHGITDARPLIVLDLSGWQGVADHVRRGAHATCVCHAIADQIEAQTKPARIPEPGLWGVVSAIYQVVSSTRQLWVNDGHGWTTLSVANAYHVASFAHLIDPTLIREGIN